MPAGTNDIDERLDAFVAACRQHGVKATHQRREIYRELARTVEHPDVQTVYRRVRRRVPSVSLDTVYRTLRLLDDKGIVCRVACQDACARFDAATERHPHFSCVKCGALLDVCSDELNALPVPASATALGTVTSVHVVFQGVCVACRNGRQRGR
ncbi:MAG: hypothetical protein A3K19_08755 [Lentisphaerae bacterium RIFOXYB12_FULL_65_16]|nr:MAG: hypothetical protein A3K18_02680 [Lentisphaerae bacterium RIFOXYA12_64_32]OGV86022.1 MAG: hypothetical protein A3K19_08755 [Lentisphaerae bacterium RIFOXYB12_FULL_65_16]